LATDLHAESSVVLTPARCSSSRTDSTSRASGSHARIAIDAPSLNERLIMSTKIFVGNLPFSVTDASLRSNFGEFGKVSSAKVMMDRDTNKSKGFGFVEMGSAEIAQAAIDGLNGMSVDGRAISVSLARPREDRATPGDNSSHGYRASNRSGVGYGTDGFGGRG